MKRKKKTLPKNAVWIFPLTKPENKVVQILNQIEAKARELKLDRDWSAVALFTLLSDLRKAHE